MPIPEWAQDNFLLGFAVGIFASFAILAIWEFGAIGIRWLKRRRARKREHLKIAKKALHPGPRPRGEKKPVPDAAPATTAAPAAPPPPRPSVPLPVVDPTRETQQMAAIQPSMFTSPPPDLPTAHTHTVVPRDWDGEDRRSPIQPPYDGPERRGRHSSSGDERARRRDDPWAKYDNPQ